jgi:tetratricopeptide (TPR) repeat protein
MQVNIWQEQVTIPTYPVGKPDKNPMFFEKRVYQGSSGVVYPHPVIEKIEDEKVDKEYTALFIENKYLKIMILPEIGGRVQMAYDKIAQRHFIYYNQVIKPALVGLCGPWISGGIEFNWPQHHRPSTFDPVDYKIEENADGSKTVWVSEVEIMFRTKGMAGFTLHPDKAYLEIKAQLYNRTNIPQTFLWWANPAVSVDDHYQSVFPPDVHAVFDHGKRDVSSFPIATGTYYKIDYSPGTDISRYKNIPVPTSYMAVNSEYNFVGGYQHDTRAGVLHVADHHVSPGKKQWTWGNGDFGIAWDRNLTDEDGPYIELMTGVYTDNQPDFSWIMPYEEKSFTQYFLPYREVGLVKNATRDVVLGWDKNGNEATIKVFVTSALDKVRITVSREGHKVFNETVNLSPENVWMHTLSVQGYSNEQFAIAVSDDQGRELVSFKEVKPEHKEIPQPAKPALLPEQVENEEQLFLTGQHLEQYRHATYSPVPYYEEALRRDPNDIRNNNALGLWLLRRGQFEKSIPYFETAIKTITQRNPNPYDSEPYYNLGLALKYVGRDKEAYDAFFKSTWSSAWQDAGYFSVAQIDIKNKDYEAALEHINWSLDRNARNGKAYLLKVHALRKLQKTDEAIETANWALKRDGFNLSVLFELCKCYQDLGDLTEAQSVSAKLKQLSRSKVSTLIEYGIEFADIGLYTDAIELLSIAEDSHPDDPMLNYYLAYYHNGLGDKDTADKYLQKAMHANPDRCFPNRLEDIIVLQSAMQQNPQDAKACYYLGNLWYDKRQYDEAIRAWDKSATIDPEFPTVFRNLAIAAYNKQNDPEKALEYFEKAYSLDRQDARVLMELDQLYKKLNYEPETRLAFLNNHIDVVLKRDDLYLEMIALENFLKNHEQAFQNLMNRKFHPWEGGEGKASGQYVYGLVELGKIDLENKQYQFAIDKLQQAQAYPINLGEGKLPGTQENDVFYWLGCAYDGLGQEEESNTYWTKATVGLAEPNAAMFYNDQQPDKIFYQGLAWEKLGKEHMAQRIFNNLVRYGLDHQNDEVRIDYFAVSLPDLLIFDDDLNKRNFIHCQYILGLGLLGLRRLAEAEKAFLTVLEEDAMHFGAKTHLEYITSLRNQTASAS